MSMHAHEKTWQFPAGNRVNPKRLPLLLLALAAGLVAPGRNLADDALPVRAVVAPTMADAEQLAAQVTIHRDEYGVPHVFGKSDRSVVFGFAYAQAEDFFWQVEDSYILALGRYSEAHGPQGLNSDLLNRAFEIVPKSRADFGKLDAKTRGLCTAFVAGINYYLAKNPHVQPRLIKTFEPWLVLAFQRQIALELCYRYTHLSSSYLPRSNRRIWAAAGSNAWAIGGSRTAGGGPMLMVNPHLPLYGFAQLYEAHLAGTEGPEGRPWSFTGATFLGSPVLTIGHNRLLGWTMTTNEPDIADVWKIRFENPERPLEYVYDGQTRTAREWREKIQVLGGGKKRAEEYIFRSTHHGPIVERVDETTRLAARISGMYEGVPMRQAFAMMKARSLDEFKTALSLMQMPFMNVIYADRAGNIYYVYNARIPRRDEAFDWSKPVDGSDPQAEWLGVHGLDELPQVLNPPSGFVQNCNSSPFITTDGANPLPSDFPSYMAEEAGHKNRRALRSLEMLREMSGVTLDQFEEAAFDTEVYWARHLMPGIIKGLQAVRDEYPELADQAQPLVDCLLDWDCRITADSTAATLCAAWYERLYGTEYPGEELLPCYKDDPVEQLGALLDAAEALERMFGDWRMPYGQVYRLQRQPFIADLAAIRFNDRGPSLPNMGGHGPMGVIFTQYHTPSLHVPLLFRQKKRYAVVGPAYLAVYEFAPEGVKSRSVVPYGTSSRPSSRHFFDQAHLLSEGRMKPVWFQREDVEQHAVRSYRPGE